MTNPVFPAPTRRTVVFSLAGGALATGLVSVSQTRKAPRQKPQAPRTYGKTSPMAKASFEQWSAAVGSLFFASTEAGPVALRLASVTGLPVVGARPSTLRRQPFEALFKPEGTARLPAGDRLYPVRQAGQGTFNLYFSAADETLKALFN